MNKNIGMVNLIVINHILFIIIMQSKSGKQIQTSVTRSSRRLRSNGQCQQKVIEPQQSKFDSLESDNNDQICINNEQQLKVKTQKQSTSIPNNEGLVITNKKQKIRRVTRSRSIISNRISHESDIQIEQITPEDNLINKIQDQQTSKKFSKSTQGQDCIDGQLLDIQGISKRMSNKMCQTLTSPYSEMRKSYRKVHKRQIISIPYRKCHDALEGRIVAILNKLEHGKNCLRDFEGLIQKMNRIANKDIMNRFIISGIKAIIALSNEKNIYDPKIIAKLAIEQKKLQDKIESELNGFQQYENDQYFKKGDLNVQNTEEFKNLMVRKLYHILKRKNPQLRGELREKIMGECSRLFQGQMNVNTMIKFIKHRLAIWS